MFMTRSAAGVLQCSCAAGFLRVGDSRVGPESCVRTAQGQSFLNNERGEWL